MIHFTSLNSNVIFLICRYLSDDDILNVACLQNEKLNSKLVLKNYNSERCTNNYLNKLHYLLAPRKNYSLNEKQSSYLFIPRDHKYYNFFYFGYNPCLIINVTNIYYIKSFLKNVLNCFREKTIQSLLSVLIDDNDTHYVTPKRYCNNCKLVIKSDDNFFINCTLLVDNKIIKTCIFKTWKVKN